jgi:hypothetical protein
MPSNALVSGAGSTICNGLYTYDSNLDYQGRPGFIKNNDCSLFWEGATYVLYSISDEIEFYQSAFQNEQNDVFFPWSVITWNVLTLQGGQAPAPTVTEVPVSSQNTFGLPADVVALITSRFGTVANFLRLRNQGQV